METAKGKVFKYGDNVDTDVIIPARYLNVSSGEELAKYCMIDIDADFVNNVKEGDIIVATKNFGCGSSREHAPLAIKCAGVSCVIASTFARIFYRNAINNGMLLIECDTDRIQDGDQLFVDIANRVIRKKNDPDFKMEFALSDKEVKIVSEVGLLNYIEKYHSLDI